MEIRLQRHHSRQIGEKGKGRWKRAVIEADFYYEVVASAQSFEVVLSDGSVFRLIERDPGSVEVFVAGLQSGRLLVEPRSSNLVVLREVDEQSVERMESSRAAGAEFRRADAVRQATPKWRD